MTFVWRTIGLAALVTVVPAVSRAADPTPQGNYQAEVLGQVELRADKDHLVGYSLGGGPCGFAARATVLEGQLQGRVMVGRLTVCTQAGASCSQAQSEVLVLALYDAEDKTLSAWVRPPEGCKVPRLGSGSAEGGLVVLRPAAPESAMRGGPDLPAALRKERPNPEAAKEALSLGKSLMERKDWKGAAEAFERSLYHNGERTDERTTARNWTAYVNLGTARLMQEQPDKAIWALQKALAINTRHPHVYKVHYDLACAYGLLKDKAQALEHFQLAVESGLPLSDGSQDKKLDALLGSDLDSFQRYGQLLLRATDNYTKAPPQSPQIAEP